MHADSWTTLPRAVRDALIKHGSAEEIGVRATTLARAFRGGLIPNDVASRCIAWYAKRVHETA